MMRRGYNDFWSFIYMPACIIILLFGLFGMVWLRSSVVSVSYDLRNLDEKKMEALKEMKTLLAERSKIISVANIGSSFQGRGNKNHKNVSSDYVFPDRAKVIQVKRRSGTETYRASLEIKK